MELRALPADVISKLRSGVAIVSIAHCMEELVFNALDAGATCIAVRLNLPYHKVQVVDNGHGMSREQLSACGERYSTSKCRTLSDLEHPKFYGYRGEAVASLVEMSGMLQIESRAAESDESYSKIFTRGHMQGISASSPKRPSVGTTVTVLDFMFNLPVRRSSVSETIDFEFCLQLLEGLALSHPRVSFTLRDDITGEKHFQTHKSGSVLETFAQLFGKRKAASLKHATLTKKRFAVEAYLSMEGHTTRSLQFAYLNKRLLLKTRIHKMFHNVLKKYVLRSQTRPGLPSSPTKLGNRHPIFVVFVKCFTKAYDITFEPRKTLVEFANWDAMTRAFECLLNGFLREHNIISHSFVLSGDLPFSQRTTPEEQAEVRPPTMNIGGDINVDEVPHALVSMKACRNRRRDADTSKAHAKTVPEAEAMLGCLDKDGDSRSIILEESHRMQASLASAKSSVEKGCCSLQPGLPLPETAIMLPSAFSSSSRNRVQLRLPKKSSLINMVHRFRFDRRDKQTRNANTCKKNGKHGARHCPTSTFCSIASPSGTPSKPEEHVSESVEAPTARSPRIRNSQDSLIFPHSRIDPRAAPLCLPVCSTSTSCSIASLSATPSKPEEHVSESIEAPTARSPRIQNSQDIPIFSNSGLEPRVPLVCLPVSNPTPLATKLKRKMTKIAKKTLGTDRNTAEEVPRSYFVGHQESVPNQDIGLVSTLVTTPPIYPCTTESFLNAAQDVFAKEIQAQASTTTAEAFVIPSKISRLDRQGNAPEVLSVPVPDREMVLQAQPVEASQPFVTTQEFDVSHLQQSAEAEDRALESAENSQYCSVVELCTEGHHDSSASTRDGEMAFEKETLLPFEPSDWSPESYCAVQKQVIENHVSKEECSVVQCGQSPKDTLAINTAQSFLQHSTLGLTALNFENQALPGHKAQSDVSPQSGADGSNENADSSSSKQQPLLETGNAVGNLLIPPAEKHSLENIETDEKLEGLTQLSPLSAGEFESVSNREEFLSGVSDLRCLQQEDERIEACKERDHVQDIEHRKKHPELAGTKHAGNWMAWVDATSGQTMYINVTSGNSAFAPPPCLEDDHQGMRLPILDMTPRSLPGPSLVHFPPRPQAERAQFGSSPGNAEQADLVDLVKVWNNPTFTRSSLQDILGAEQHIKVTSTTACYGITQSYKFTKEMLSNVKVIGQVDAKFIACLMPVCDKGMFQEDSLIVLFDQHAAHERARLEWLLENQYEAGQGSCLRSSSLKPPLNVTLDPDVVRRAAVCEKELRKLGVHLGAIDQQGLVLERLPSCLVERDESERRCGRPSTIAAQAQ
ncbi:unnamed protein product, partial [Ixodes hexagonus]